MRQGIRDGKLTFGKYRGVPLSAVPLGYLGWLVDESLTIEYAMSAAVYAEIRRRIGAGAPTVAVTSLRLPPAISPDAVRLLVDTGYRAAARTHHPDVGGDTAQMQQLNAAAAWLREQLRG